MPHAASRFIRANPAEAAIQQPERIELSQLQLDLNLVTVHLAVEDHLIRRGPFEGKRRLPVFASAFRERDRLAVLVDGNAISGKRIVEALKSHAVRNIKDDATPAAIVVVESC